MKTAPLTPDMPSERLSPQEVESTFDKLGLNDPRVRQFYDQLYAMPDPDMQPQYWIQTHIHSNIPYAER